MNKQAGFLKRFSAFVVDLTLVIIITWLLYLFPFNVIINKSIDKSYRKNVKNPYEEISEKYSGTVSYFGSSTDGYFTIIKSGYTNGSMNENDYNTYYSKVASIYTDVKSDANDLLVSVNVSYDENTKNEDLFTSTLYEIYSYLEGGYAVLYQFPHDSEYVKYESKLTQGLITESEKTTLDAEYQADIKEKYGNCLEALLKAAKLYEEKNADSQTLDSLSISTIESKLVSISSKTIDDVDSSFNEEDKKTIVDFIDEYYNYASYVASKTTLGTSLDTENAQTLVNIAEEAYYVLYYTLAVEETIEQMPYYVQVYNHTKLSIIYSFSMFTLIFSIYTIVLRGATIGRRISKIRLTDGKDMEKLNPVLALLHDVPFRFLYVILIGFFSLMIAIALMVIFTIVDFIMIKFTKKHKCLRDMMSGTVVLEGSSVGKY